MCAVAQVTRHVWDQAAGKSVAQSEVLEVPIKAGWKAGTKITYAGEGHVVDPQATNNSLLACSSRQAVSKQQHLPPANRPSLSHG